MDNTDLRQPPQSMKPGSGNYFFETTTDNDHESNVSKACELVLTSQPEQLLNLLEEEPSLFFCKHPEVQDLAGQIFYNASPCDLIYL